MTDSMIDVHVVEREQLMWSFRESRPTVPAVTRNAEVDPTPAYAHDPAVVWDAVDVLLERFVPPVPVWVVLLPFEEVGRTNGYSDRKRPWHRNGPVEPDQHVIVLSAKRIPPHPAVTRYLVAHEMGHHVQLWVMQAMGFDLHDEPGFEDHYARVRGMDRIQAAPGEWHWATSELFADDFRLMVAGAETEYWPHPRIPRSETIPAVVEWWECWRELDLSNTGRLAPEALPTVVGS